MMICFVSISLAPRRIACPVITVWKTSCRCWCFPALLRENRLPLVPKRCSPEEFHSHNGA